MPAYMDLEPGCRIYTIPETVVSLVPELAANPDNDGLHRTGRAFLTTRLGTIESTRTVMLSALVHAEEGCMG